MVDTKGFVWGTGRRKTSVARVRIRPGTGQFLVNKRTVEDYFHRNNEQQEVYAPLKLTKAFGRYDVFCNVNGGGFTGQAGAIVMGLARALVTSEPELKELLKAKGYTTRDAREVERKKYGHRKARRSFQFSKR